MPRLKIGEKVYPEIGFDQVALKDMLVFDQQVADAGLPYKWADIREFGDAVDKMPEKERAWDTRAVFLGAVSMWLSMRGAGDAVTFDEVISMPSSDFTWLPDPGDRKDPTKGPKRPKRSSAVSVVESITDENQTSEIQQPSESLSTPA